MKKILLVSLGSVISFSLFTWFVYSKGQSDIQAKWDKEKDSQISITRQIQSKYDLLEKAHKELSQGIDQRLKDKDAEKEKAIADASSAYADGMRKSDNRASVYRNQAQTGAIERERLASYAAELDRSIVEGKRVAAELAATVRLRDSQLIELGNQIRADRLALEEIK